MTMKKTAAGRRTARWLKAALWSALPHASAGAAHPARHAASSALQRAALNRRAVLCPAAVFFIAIMPPVLPVPWGTSQRL